MSAGAERSVGCEYAYSPWSERLFADTVSISTMGSRLIFASGKGSEDPQTGEVQFPGDCAAQTRYAYDQLRSMLEHHGAGLEHVVRLTVFLTQMDDDRSAYEERQIEAFADIPHMPSHTLVGVTTLAHPAMVVEIEAIAVLP